MLDKLRAEALALIAATPLCTLSTSGPAGVQASVVTCMVYDACVYVHVPSTVDHLFNLEQTMELVLTTSQWQLRGVGLALVDAQGRHGTVPHAISASVHMAGHLLVEVFPLRMHIEATGQRRYRETIDFDLRARQAMPEHLPSAS